MQGHNDLRGIVNGIDYDDLQSGDGSDILSKIITRRISAKKKLKNKRALQEELGLEKDDKKFMIGIVSRLTDQKGLRPDRTM